jgi:hypothetical protein
MYENAVKSAFIAATISASDSASPLDSLLSPKGPPLTPLRDSVAESDYNDVILEDDPRFSTVSLSEQASVASSVPGLDEVTTKLERRTTISSAPSKAIASLRHFTHKKSASSVTAGEISDANILARLGIQKSHQEHDPDALRSAGQGQQKLREEFLRLHKERRAEVAHSEEGAIDWGAWWPLPIQNLANH